MPEIVIYSRENCHLCHDAVALLEQFGAAPRVIDIDGDEQLRNRYGECVPVVVVDGVERFRGRIEPRLLRRIFNQLRR
jgi:glutaredoxin